MSQARTRIRGQEPRAPEGLWLTGQSVEGSDARGQRGHGASAHGATVKYSNDGQDTRAQQDGGQRCLPLHMYNARSATKVVSRYMSAIMSVRGVDQEIIHFLITPHVQTSSDGCFEKEKKAKEEKNIAAHCMPLRVPRKTYKPTSHDGSKLGYFISVLVAEASVFPRDPAVGRHEAPMVPGRYEPSRQAYHELHSLDYGLQSSIGPDICLQLDEMG
ncbi:hypothetical protein EDB92DRAFT_1812889 [Lactarius akahatsu]|uniref:Uncharacterized protein n=1 Tax=Lactarius akahatsu TaxID=416441 RepID=A0AAD4LQF2_9AGAM|nr:hypothetical protein EDB92DRAFT_1812889 [Lactarius akahatsu]